MASKLQKQFEQSVGKVEDKLVYGQVYIQQIIREQEILITTSEKRIQAINKDFRALQFRLKPYIKRKPKPYDETYFKLKDEYKDLLGRRAVLQRTIITAEESISYVKLNTMPGQTYQSGEQL